MLDRLKRIVEAGHAAGMRVGLVEAANDAFKSSPREVRNTLVPDPMGRHGNFGVQLCPAKPKAYEQLLRDWDRLLDEFAGFEFSPEVVDQLAGVVQTLEKNHARRSIGPSAGAAFETVRQAEAKLTPQAKAA